MLTMNRPHLSARRLITILIMLLVLLFGAILLIISESYPIVQPLKTTLNVIGGFLAISVITSFLYSVTLRSLDDASRKEELQKLLHDVVDRLIKGRLWYGL